MDQLNQLNHVMDAIFENERRNRFAGCLHAIESTVISLMEKIQSKLFRVFFKLFDYEK